MQIPTTTEWSNWLQSEKCPEEELLDLYANLVTKEIAGFTLDPKMQKKIEDHLQRCSDCADSLHDFKAIIGNYSNPEYEPGCEFEPIIHWIVFRMLIDFDKLESRQLLLYFVKNHLRECESCTLYCQSNAEHLAHLLFDEDLH